MPNVDTLIKSLNTAVEDTLAPGDAIAYFNSALLDLAKVARISSKTIIPFLNTDRSTTLPNNISELRSVDVNMDGYSKPYALTELADGYGLTVEENQEIEWWADLPASGSFTVRYYRTPTLLVSTSDTPEIPEIFHDALVYFATREYFLADDEPERAASADTKYQRKKGEFDQFTKERGVTGQPYFASPKPPWMR